MTTTTDAGAFLSGYLRDYIHLVAITPDGPITGRYFGADAAAAGEWAAHENAAGRNIYWTVNLVTPGLNTKPKKSDIIGIRCAHVDVDPPKVGNWDKPAALEALVTRGAPSVVIDSGNGWQALWWLNEVTDVATIEHINQGIQEAFKADHCWNVDRLLRLPGTTNYPDAKKRLAGRTASHAAIAVPFNGNIYAPGALLQAFPAVKRDVVDIIDWLSTGPDPRYTGPQDDDELIAKMLASQGSIGAIMGGKLSVKELWHADQWPWKLAEQWPSDKNDVYDRSKADSALMSHLAFWTGKDAPRMERLFRRSALMRDKFNRRDYREGTITKAVSLCSKVYDYAPSIAPASPVPPGSAASAGTASEVLTIGEQVEYFKGCVYVRSSHRVMIPNGEMLKPEQFKTWYGGKKFMMSAGGTEPTKNAFEAFTENRAWLFPKVSTTCFRPQATPGAIIGDKVNIYFPVDRNWNGGDVAPFLDLLAKLLPNEHDRLVLLSYAASCVQNPGVKFQWAPVVQGTEGNGKSVIMKCVEHGIGEKYYHEPAANDLANPFNSYIENKLFIGVEEVYLGDRRELLDTLKPLITNTRVEVQPKGVDKYMVDNYANWWFNTNHRDAVTKTGNDRRYSIFFTAQQTYDDIRRDGMDGLYFPRLWDWLRGGGFDAVAHYLLTFAIPPELDPAGLCHRAPLTSTTDQAIAATMGRAEQEVMEAIELNTAGFRGGWVSSHKLGLLLKERGVKMAPQRVKAMMEALGYSTHGRVGSPLMEEDLARPILYLKPFDASATPDDYRRAQGYRV